VTGVYVEELAMKRALWSASGPNSCHAFCALSFSFSLRKSTTRCSKNRRDTVASLSKALFIVKVGYISAREGLNETEQGFRLLLEIDIKARA
jgi:hypothetical protein